MGAELTKEAAAGVADQPAGERAGATYHVLVNPQDGRHSCECPGFLRWGHCKHVETTQQACRIFGLLAS